jgi:hypothetical protein
MLHRPRLGWAVLIALLFAAPLAVAAPAPEAANPLSVVPAGAMMVVHLKGWENGRERFLTLLKAAMPEVAPLLRQQIDAGLRAALANGRTLKGVSKDGSVMLVFTEVPTPPVWFLFGFGPGGGPNTTWNDLASTTTLLVPVTSYADFRNGLLLEDERKRLKAEEGYEYLPITDDVAVCFVDRKDGYAAVTFDKKLAAKFAGKITGADRDMPKDLAKKFLDADVSVWFNAARFNTKYAKDIDQLKKDMLAGLDQLPPGNALTEFVKPLTEPGFQVFSECETFVLAAEFRADGLAVGATAEFSPSGQFNTALKGAQPTALDELAKMPQGFAGYSITEVRAGLFKDNPGLLLGVLGDPDDKDLRKACQAFVDAGPRLRVDASGFPWQGVQVWTCDDPAKAAAAQLKVFEAMKQGHSLMGIPLKEKPKVKAVVQKHGGFELHQAKLVWDPEEVARRMGIPAGQQDFLDFVKSWVGEEMNVFFGTDGKRLVVATGKDWDVAKGHLDRYLRGERPLAEQQAFKEVRKGLPAEATTLILGDVPLCTATFYDALKPAFVKNGQPLTDGFQVAIGQGKPNYAGLAMTVRPRRLSMDFFMPVPTANEIYRLYFEKLVKGGGGPP